MQRAKEPLYRRVNTKARGVPHRSGGEARHDRHTKVGLKRTMGKDVHRGLDYTPLFMFLLSRVGKDWEPTLKEAQGRINDEKVIYYMVASNENAKDELFRYGESSLYNGLFVDEDGILRKVNADLSNEDLHPTCTCCTHTFNGKPFVNKVPMRTLRG